MRVTIVGSGTLLPDDLHRSPGHLVDWRGGSLLLDCGSGVLHGLARDGLDWRGITHLAITHFHTDHFGDLAPLLWAWTHGVPSDGQRKRTLVGPPGLRLRLEALATAFGSFILAPGGALEVIELSPGDLWEDPGGELRIRSFPTRHTAESVGYRVEVEGRTVAYTGDAGPDSTLARAVAGVDLLIAECAVPDGSGVMIHLSPGDVGELAQRAAPATLVLTHLYPTVPREEVVGLVRARGFSGEVIVAKDGLRIEL